MATAAPSIETVAELVDKLHEERRGYPSPKPPHVVDCSRAAGRYHQSLKYLQIALKEGYIPATSADKISFDDHAKCLEDLEKAIAMENASYKRHTIVIDKIFKEVAEVIVNNNEFLPPEWNGEEKHDVVASEPECRLWWLGAFGERLKIPWKEFWVQLAQYMRHVYAVGPDIKIKSDEEPESETETANEDAGDDDDESDDEEESDDDEEDESYEGFETAIKNVFAVKSKVSMDSFRDFYWRYGPWPDLYRKSITLCELDGDCSGWFFPTKKGNRGKSWLKKNKHEKFFVRYSSQPGCLVKETRVAKQLILNGEQGYVAKKHPIPYPDIPSLLTNSLKVNVEHNADEWVAALDALDTEADSKGYKALETASSSEVSNTDVLRAVERVGSAVGSMHDDLMQIGLRLLTSLESTMPRLFFIIPEEPEDGHSVYEQAKAKVTDAFQSNWRIFLLCEGNEFIEKDGEQHYKCHLTEHEGFQITLPREAVVKALPYIRVGLKVMALACSTAGLVDLDVGPITDLLDNLAGADKFALLEDKLADAQELLTGKTAALPQDQSKVADNYKALRVMLDEWLPKEDLEGGNCADLRLMWHKGGGKRVWVCKHHEKGLVGLEDDVKHDLEGPLKGPPGTGDSDDDDDEEVPSFADMSDIGRRRSLLKLKDATLRVYCEKATNLKNVDYGLLGDKSDPYCRVQPVDMTEGHLPRQETQIKYNNLNPVWNEVFEWKPHSAVQYVDFEVWDWNKMSSHVLLGTCRIKIIDTGEGSFEHEAELQLMPKPGLPNNAKGTVNVKVEYEFTVVG